MTKKETKVVKKVLVDASGVLAGLIYAFWAYGKHSGEIGRMPNIRIYVNSLELLPHHWLLYPLIALGIYYFFKKKEKLNSLIYFMVFFLLGAAIQSFTYNDWWVLLK